MMTGPNRETFPQCPLSSVQNIPKEIQGQNNLKEMTNWQNIPKEILSWQNIPKEILNWSAVNKYQIARLQ